MDYISNEVKRIKKKYGEDDPYKICDAMGIIVLYVAMGTSKGACKGFFVVQKRKMTIIINSDLPEHIQKIILAHELGHAVLHRKRAEVSAFHDFILYDETSLFEYEANIFAAEFLMNDDDVFDILNEDISFFGAASALNVPMELLDFKFRTMKRKGYMLIDPPIMARGDFLKREF
jgi:Zn-dependent peptidase ImmA (M78 family)